VYIYLGYYATTSADPQSRFLRRSDWPQEIWRDMVGRLLCTVVRSVPAACTWVEETCKGMDVFYPWKNKIYWILQLVFFSFTTLSILLSSAWGEGGILARDFVFLVKLVLNLILLLIFNIYYNICIFSFLCTLELLMNSLFGNIFFII